MPVTLSPRWHAVALFLCCAFVSLIYTPVTGTYYCGFDDFMELHRAAFEDSQNPSHIWTDTHRGSNKYRPIYRLANDVTFWWGHGAPIAYRVRNLVLHCLTVATVYLLGLTLFSWPVAVGGALLFGLHPLTHQAVAVAVFYNPGPNMQFLLTIALFLVGYRAARPLTRWLAISFGLLSGCIALFTYEPSLVAFGLLYTYLVIDFLVTGKRPPLRFVLLLTLGVALTVASYFLTRRLLITSPPTNYVVTAPLIIIRNLAMYIIALFLPVDSILAHDWFGTPLPRYIQFTAKLWVLLGVVGSTILASLWFFRRTIGRRLRELPLTATLFLLVATVSSLALFLLFTDHASETYVAVPAAFFSVAFCGVLWHWCRPRPLFYGLTLGLLISLNALACWNRGERIISCGDIASRLVADLPAQFRQGPATIWLSNYPGDEQSLAYGIYGYKGLDTLGPDSETVQAAVQTVFFNQQLQVRRVSPAELLNAAKQPLPGHHYYFVHSDGTLGPARGALF